MESRLKIRCSNTSYDQIDVSYRLHVLKSTEQCAERNFQFEEESAKESTRAGKFATFASKLGPVANCSEQTANQNTNIAAEVCKVAGKRTSGLTVIEPNHAIGFD